MDRSDMSRNVEGAVSLRVECNCTLRAETIDGVNTLGVRLMVERG